MAGRAGRIIDRAQEARLQVEKCHHIFLVPDVVASRDHRHTGPEKVDCYFSGDAATAGGIFTVYDCEIDSVACLQFRQFRDHRTAARLAHDVAEEKNAEHWTSFSEPAAKVDV